MIYALLCAQMGPAARETVNCIKLDAESRSAAAVEACRRFGWLRAKVRPSGPIPPGALAQFELYDANGRKR